MDPTHSALKNHTTTIELIDFVDSAKIELEKNLEIFNDRKEELFLADFGDIRVSKLDIPNHPIGMIHGYTNIKNSLKERDIDEISALNLAAVIDNPSARKKWDDIFQKANILLDLSPLFDTDGVKVFLAQSFTRAIWPTSGRTLVVLLYTENTKDRFISIAKSVPQNMLKSLADKYDFQIGDSKTYVGAWLDLGAWKIEKQDNGTLLAQYVVQTDPRGSIPDAILKYLGKQFPLCIKGVIDYQKKHGSPPYVVSISNNLRFIQSNYDEISGKYEGLFHIEITNTDHQITLFIDRKKWLDIFNVKIELRASLSKNFLPSAVTIENDSREMLKCMISFQDNNMGDSFTLLVSREDMLLQSYPKIFINDNPITDNISERLKSEDSKSSNEFSVSSFAFHTLVDLHSEIDLPSNLKTKSNYEKSSQVMYRDGRKKILKASFFYKRFGPEELFTVFFSNINCRKIWDGKRFVEGSFERYNNEIFKCKCRWKIESEKAIVFSEDIASVRYITRKIAENLTKVAIYVAMEPENSRKQSEEFSGWVFEPVIDPDGQIGTLSTFYGIPDASGRYWGQRTQNELKTMFSSSRLFLKKYGPAPSILIPQTPMNNSINFGEREVKLRCVDIESSKFDVTNKVYELDFSLSRSPLYFSIPYSIVEMNSSHSKKLGFHLIDIGLYYNAFLEDPDVELYHIESHRVTYEISIKHSDDGRKSKLSLFVLFSINLHANLSFSKSDMEKYINEALEFPFSAKLIIKFRKVPKLESSWGIRYLISNERPLTGQLEFKPYSFNAFETDSKSTALAIMAQEYSTLYNSMAILIFISGLIMGISLHGLFA